MLSASQTWVCHICTFIVPDCVFFVHDVLMLKSDYAERAIYSRPPAVSIARPDYPPSVNRPVLSCQAPCYYCSISQSSRALVSSVMPRSCSMSIVLLCRVKCHAMFLLYVKALVLRFYALDS